jgi:hypothetical protein
VKTKFVSLCFFGLYFICSAAEISIPDVESLGQKLVAFKSALVIGETNSIQPSHLEIDLNDDGTIVEMSALYPKNISIDAMNSSLERQLGPPTKKFIKESGSNLYEWRNEAKRFAVMYSEKSEQDGRPLVLIRYLGKSPKPKH